MSRNEKNPLRAPDPRPARTRAAIIAAVESIGASGAELNVSSIVKEAGLSRSSFYSQFKDVGDIAVQLIAELMESPAVRGVTDATQGDDEATKGTIHVESFVEGIYEHRFVYGVLLGGSADSAAQRQVCEMMTRESLPAFLRYAQENETTDFDPEFMARFLAAGTLANIVAWLCSDDPVSTDEMVRRLRSAIPHWAPLIF